MGQLGFSSYSEGNMLPVADVFQKDVLLENCKGPVPTGCCCCCFVVNDGASFGQEGDDDKEEQDR